MFKKSLVASTASTASILMFLSGCGVSEVDIPALEEDIVNGIEDETGAVVTADCPDQVDWATGDSFACAVEFDDGTTREVDVEMVDDDGNVTWSLPPAE